MAKKSKQYVISVTCDNCNFVGNHAIKFGTLVNDKTTKGPKCPACGCKTLRKSAYQNWGGITIQPQPYTFQNLNVSNTGIHGLAQNGTVTLDSQPVGDVTSAR